MSDNHETPAGMATRRVAGSGSFRLMNVLLAGVLLVLGGLLYVTYESTGQNMRQNKTMLLNDQIIVDQLTEAIENQNEMLEHQRAKELACEFDGGGISWNTRGNQVCDLEPFTRQEDGMFDFDIDWIIR